MLFRIRGDEDNEFAIHLIEELMDREPGAWDWEGELLRELAEMVEGYESIHYPIDPPTEEGARQFRWEQEHPDDDHDGS